MEDRWKNRRDAASHTPSPSGTLYGAHAACLYTWVAPHGECVRGSYHNEGGRPIRASFATSTSTRICTNRWVPVVSELERKKKALMQAGQYGETAACACTYCDSTRIQVCTGGPCTICRWRNILVRIGPPLQVCLAWVLHELGALQTHAAAPKLQAQGLRARMELRRDEQLGFRGRGVIKEGGLCLADQRGRWPSLGSV